MGLCGFGGVSSMRRNASSSLGASNLSLAIMRYNPDQIAFYATLGHAITTWAEVERGLYFVYLAAIGNPMSMTAGAAFFSIINFNAKLAMVDNVMGVRYYHYPDVLERWTTIKNSLNRRSKKRNLLAHWQLLIFSQNGKMTHKLVPQIFDPNTVRDGKDRPELTVEDIEAIDMKFRECAYDLDRLTKSLQEEPRPEFAGPEDHKPNH